MTTNLCHACIFAAKSGRKGPSSAVPAVYPRGVLFSASNLHTLFTFCNCNMDDKKRATEAGSFWSFKKSTEYSSIRNITSQYKPYNRSDIWNWHPLYDCGQRKCYERDEVNDPWTAITLLWPSCPTATKNMHTKATERQCHPLDPFSLMQEGGSMLTMHHHSPCFFYHRTYSAR